MGRERAKKQARAADSRPPAPWGKFPLVELAVLAGLVLIVLGLITGSPTQLLLGLMIGSVGGLEVALRDHFSGFRSHTTLLASVGFVLVAVLCFLAFGLPFWTSLVLGAAAFAGLLLLLWKGFQKASGGRSYKLR
jgi:hypothetical protein